MTLPAETSLNRTYSLQCQIMQDGGNLASNSDTITIVPTDGDGTGDGDGAGTNTGNSHFSGKCVIHLIIFYTILTFR